MLSKAIIQKVLKSNFSAVTRRRGLVYFERDMVLGVEIHKDENMITAEVSGSANRVYEVEFEWDPRYKTLHGDCDCPFDENCKHQVAVLYELIEWAETQERNPPPLPLANSRQSTSPSPLIAEDLSGTYRLLPSGHRLSNILHRIKPRSYRALGWNEDFQGTFISESELELENVSHYDFYNFTKLKIALRKDEKGLAVKCLTCNKKTKTLCPHQMALLTKAAYVLDESGFVSGELNYQSVVDHTTKSSGVTPEAFDKYFKILINQGGFIVQSMVDHLVNENWVKTANQVLDLDKHDRQRIIKEQTTQLQESRNKKFAFLWAGNNYDHENDEIPLYFVSGFGFKTKEGIHATNRVFDQVPINLPASHRQLGQQLFFHCQEPDLAKRFQLVKTIIEEELEAFNALYQYVYYDDPLYQKPKASDLHLIKFDPNPIDCAFSVKKVDGLVEVSRHLRFNDKPFDYGKVIFSNEIFSATKTTAYLHPNHQFRHFMSLFNDADQLLIPFTSKKDLTKLINGFKQYFEVEIEPNIVMKEDVLSQATFQILLREVGDFVLFEPRLKYDDYSFNAYDEDSYTINRKVLRPDEADRNFLVDFLKNTHPDFDNDIQVQDYVYLDIKSMINNYWFAHFIEACEAAGIEVLGQDNLSKFKYSKFRASTYSYVKSGIDWFEVDMGLSFGEEKVKVADWIRALRNKESFVTLKDGSLGILPEEWLEQAKKILAVADVEKGSLKISKYRFNVIEDLFEDIDDKKLIKELKEKKKRLASYDTSKKYKIPKIIKADLRPYQMHGFTWLKFLDASEFGGILADDMGLGKTLQVICLLADQIDRGTSIVIVPRSLLFNWSAELDKFCPDLKYVIHHGTGRTKALEEFQNYNIIITTYGTAAADIDLFKDLKFNYIILDESQAIKNPESKRYKAMRLLQSRNKIAMTGTPIENNTFDLYAQLSFTSPGLLGTKTGFKNSFAIPIDNYGDQEAANLLRKLIHPFLLRRTKQQVAKDLPEKTESIIYCEMGATQRKLYQNLKNKIKEDIEAVVEEKGLAKSKFQMLDGLLRLRQMCNSPLLLNDSFTGANAESVKINILLQNITEELDQHNALIFSQFVSLLTIVRKELDKRGIKYAYLDGSTTKRQEEVEKFMGQDDIKIFLISLKAGNTGMNLTKADYVYILDPWWNPAVEAQAIDRTHRIGQDKQIFAYKLICKDSIEEKILKLQEKKKSLAEDIIKTDENVLKSLDKQELMALFD